MQIDREELAAFIEEKSQKLSVDKDFVVAMDRLNQFALRMRQRERAAQVNPALATLLRVPFVTHMCTICTLAL